MSWFIVVYCSCRKNSVESWTGYCSGTLFCCWGETLLCKTAPCRKHNFSRNTFGEMSEQLGKLLDIEPQGDECQCWQVVNKFTTIFCHCLREVQSQSCNGVGLSNQLTQAIDIPCSGAAHSEKKKNRLLNSLTDSLVFLEGRSCLGICYLQYLYPVYSISS